MLRIFLADLLYACPQYLAIRRTTHGRKPEIVIYPVLPGNFTTPNQLQIVITMKLFVFK